MEILEEYVAFLDRELEGLELVSVVEFGSHAKDEALPDSDHDLCVVVRSPTVAHVSACYPRDATYDEFVRRWPGVEILGGDLRDDLNRRWSGAHGGSRDVWISGPVVDVRWLLHRLALAGDPELLERMTAGQAWSDPVGFHDGLKRRLRQAAGFDTGLVLRTLGDAARSSLDGLSAVGEHDDEHDVPWIHTAVAALRTAVARFCLAVIGEARWQRQVVSAIVVRELPSEAGFVRRLYEAKCTEAGRAELRKLFATDREALRIRLARDSDALRRVLDRLLACGASRPAPTPEAARRNLALLEEITDQ